METVAAFDLLNIPNDVQKSVLRLFAGLLLMGNIGFVDGNDEYAEIDVSAFGHFRPKLETITIFPLFLS